MRRSRRSSSRALPPAPAPGYAVEVWGETLVVHVWPRDRALAVIMALVSTFFAVVCVVVTYQAFKQPRWPQVGLAAMLGGAWLLILGLSLWLTVRREELQLDRRGLWLRTRIVVPYFAQHVPVEELRDVGEYASNVKVNGQRLYGVEVRTAGRPVRFAAGLLPPARAEVAQALRDQLARLHPSAATGPAAESALDPFAPRPLFDDSHDPVKPPSDSPWRRCDDFDAVVFAARGRWSASALGPLLFITVIWNGVVLGIAALEFDLFGAKQQAGADQVGSLLSVGLLVVFGTIGLLLAGALVVAMAEPLRVTRWEFGRDEVRQCVRWLGLGPTWRYSAEAVDRIEVAVDVEARPGKPRGWQGFDAMHESQNPLYTVRLMAGQQTVCAVPRLGEGEARWIANVLRRERPEWGRGG